MIEPFRYIEGTDHREFQSFGRTLGEAFGNAVLAVINVMTDVTAIKNNEERTVKIEAPEKEEALIEFLTEVLYLLDVENFVPAKVADIEIAETDTGWSIKAKLEGDDADNYEFSKKVEAVTHQDLDVFEEDGVWMVQAVLECDEI